MKMEILSKRWKKSANGDVKVGEKSDFLSAQLLSMNETDPVL